MPSTTYALAIPDDDLPDVDSGAWSAEVERVVDGLEAPESGPHTLRLQAEERRFLVASAFSSDPRESPVPASGTSLRSDRAEARDDEPDEEIPPTLRVPTNDDVDEVTPDSTPSVAIMVDQLVL